MSLCAIINPPLAALVVPEAPTPEIMLITSLSLDLGLLA